MIGTRWPHRGRSLPSSTAFCYPRRRVFSLVYVCLLFNLISRKNDAVRITKRHRNVPRWVLEPHLFWVKGQRSRSRVTRKTKCVGFQTECNIAAYCVRKLRWVFHAAMLRRLSHASDTTDHSTQCMGRLVGVRQKMLSLNYWKPSAYQVYFTV